MQQKGGQAAVLGQRFFTWERVWQGSYAGAVAWCECVCSLPHISPQRVVFGR